MDFCKSLMDSQRYGKCSRSVEKQPHPVHPEHNTVYCESVGGEFFH